MLSVKGLSKHYGARALLDDVAFTIGEGERVGLVGRNGCGKTTLLRIIAGHDAASSGYCSSLQHGRSLGYLPQTADFPAAMTVIEAARSCASAGVPEWSVRKALVQLGIGPGWFERPVRTLSGGETTRLMLAVLLTCGHDLLLLDEPTSHLDIAALEWLERALASSGAAVVVASHDRVFLDRIASRILELEDGRIAAYHGGYTDYAAQKQAELERRHDAYVLQQKQIRALRELADRQMRWAARCESGPKAGSDRRGRIAAKIARRGHATERKLTQIERVQDVRDRDGLNAAFAPARPAGGVVVEARDVAKRYGDRTLYEGVTLTVRAGERIGIVGANGAGKSTLVRMLLGAEEPTSGSVRLGPSVSAYLLDQNQQALPNDASVLDVVLNSGGLAQTDARTLLACFLFREGDVLKKVRSLSGGERVRLAMAQALVSGANTLVLDEPTDRLDTMTRERLEQSLAAFSGTLIVVSHDRWMLDRLTKRTIAIGAGRVTDYAGRFSEWAARFPAVE